jgi:hypothetical protein
MKQIINKWYNIFGYEIEIRMLPHEFKMDLKHLSNLVDDKKYSEFKQALDTAYKRWGYDPELIRISTFADFMEE